MKSPLRIDQFHFLVKNIKTKILEALKPCEFVRLAKGNCPRPRSSIDQKLTRLRVKEAGQKASREAGKG